MDRRHPSQPLAVRLAAAGPARAATLIVVALCAGLAVVSALQLYVARLASDEPTRLADALLYGLAAWIPWAAAAPLVLAAGRRFAFGPGGRLASLAAHLGLFALCYVPFTTGLVYLSLALFGNGERLTREQLISTVFAGSRTQLGVLLYLGLLGLGAAARTWFALRDRELQASRLEAQAARARLEALASRLQPHFLFNTLHAIGVLVEEDPARARAMITRLGDLLRDLIGGATEGEVPLREELELLRRYLAIEQVRFADRLRVEVTADPTTLDLPVPRLLLQPLAENALRHGLAPRAAPGTLTVRATRDAGGLEVVVANDGVPLAPHRPDGVGLATTRERLATRVPPGSLTLAQCGALVEARVRLPAVAP